MPSERDKMLAGEWYDPLDPYLVQRRAWARSLCQDLNATHEDATDQRRAAGSVVTRDVPAGVIAAGNPCRVIREISE